MRPRFSGGVPGSLPGYFSFLCGLLFLSYCFTFVYIFLIPLLIAAGVRGDVAALVQSLSILVASVAQPWFGRLLDRGHHGWVVFAAAAGISTGCGLLLLEQLSWTTASLAVIAFSSGFALVQTCATRCLEAAVAGSLRPKAVNLAYLAQNAGCGIAALLAYFFLKEHRDLLILGDALTTLSLCLGMSWVFRFRMPLPVAGTPEALTERKSLPTSRMRAFPALSCLLVFILMSSEKTTIPILFHRNGLPVEQMAALSLGINTMTVIVITSLIARNVLRMSEASKLLASTACLALGLAALPACNTVVAVSLVTILWSIGEAIGHPAFSVLILNSFLPEEQGLASGVKILLIRSGQVIAPLISAALFSLPLWTFSAAILAIGIAALALLRRPTGAVASGRIA